MLKLSSALLRDYTLGVDDAQTLWARNQIANNKRTEKNSDISKEQQNWILMTISNYTINGCQLLSGHYNLRRRKLLYAFRNFAKVKRLGFSGVLFVSLQNHADSDKFFAVTGLSHASNEQSQTFWCNEDPIPDPRI